MAIHASQPQTIPGSPRAGAAPDPREAAAAAVRTLYEPIGADLARVRAAYREALASDDPYISNLVSYIEDYSGKMLRPALMLLAAKACGGVRDEHITLAVVAEMIHTATLVHDDILDNALMRRQRPSINQLSGNEVTVLLGDHLFSHALELALTLGDPTGAHRFSRAVSRTCLGEITQVHNRGNLEINEDTYFRVLRGKTAELYATSAELGAYYAGGGTDAALAMYRYGLNLGVAFQIMDDVLDLRGDEATVGKTLGTDLAALKATLPVIHYLSGLKGRAREEALAALRECQQPRARAAMMHTLEQSGSLEAAERRAAQFIADAKQAIAFLDGQPMHDFLRRIADFVVTREL